MTGRTAERLDFTGSAGMVDKRENIFFEDFGQYVEHTVDWNSHLILLKDGKG